MKILVTGAKGFVGKNLCAALKNVQEGKDKTRGIDSNIEIFEYDIDTDKALLETYCKEADFVFNLAGVNRPQNQEEFMEGNFGFASTLLETLKKYNNTCPVMLSSSLQATLIGRYAEGDYGKSKKAGEDLFFKYSEETGAKVYVYRFPNLFGKWCRPNYNSAVSTFCNNIANGLPITVNDPNVDMKLVYIDDVVAEFANVLEKKVHKNEEFCYVPTVHEIKLGKIVELIEGFKKSRENLLVPDQNDEFSKKLYATYLSYLPKDDFSYPLKMNVDERGSFTEFLKTDEYGQVSVNVAKPGIVKGNHYHNTKNEKFLVVSGKATIRFRKPDENEVIEYFVSGDKLEVVDIPTGYTHNIENIGENDLVTIMWANEKFDPENPDTYFLKV